MLTSSAPLAPSLGIPRCVGLRFRHLGFRDLGFRDLGFRPGLGFRESGFGVWDLGFTV